MSNVHMRTNRASDFSPEPRRRSARGLPRDVVEVVDHRTGLVVFIGILADAQRRVGDDDALNIRLADGESEESSPPKADHA